MRLNDTTRTYFERLARNRPPERAAIYRTLVDPKQPAALANAQRYLREHDPAHIPCFAPRWSRPSSRPESAPT